MNQEQIALNCTLKMFSKVTVDGTDFGVAIYCDSVNRDWCTGSELLTALGVHKQRITPRIFDLIEKLELVESVDYVVKVGEDPVVDKPEYLFTLDASFRIADSFGNKASKAALVFLEAVRAYNYHDVLRMMVYDLLIRHPVFTLVTMARIMAHHGYNNGDFNEEILIDLLKNDKILTKTLRPRKGYEACFLVLNKKTFVTAHGFTHIMRRYMGCVSEDSIAVMAENMAQAIRKHSDSLFDNEIKPQTLMDKIFNT